MSDSKEIPDAMERRLALDPEQSFIVQAPAGSGKTELLIQRYLRLLACVDAPEEIVAITFTRKAAAEMLERILLALEAAKAPMPASCSAHEKLTHGLAQAVLRHDGHLGWLITDNPVRLRIQTIDSLCASLTRQMPMLSKFGSQLETTEDAFEIYLDAARVTIEMVESNDAVAQDIERLLQHLDNDMARIESLLAEMLVRRDHWLRHVHSKTRDELEAALENIRYDALDHVASLFPDSLQNELLALLRYAASNLIASGQQSPIVACIDLERSLGEWSVKHWRGVAGLLLTKEGEWRKKWTVSEGFPPGKTKAEKETARQWKGRIFALIEILRANDDLRRALNDMCRLPPPYYTETQWEVLGAITRLLPYAVGQLKVVFQLSGKVDFTEVAQGALLALGTPDAPTDLALALDYRIRHLLIDEFQDTSISQYQLIEKLIAGWEEGDGRSLFAVGDPMQSIYRFREAEVGLFLRARNQGIGNIVLYPITLCANFRSQGGIVEWVNDTFSRIMPVNEDISLGAVSYVSSVATHAVLEKTAVMVHPFFNNAVVGEAKKVAEIVWQYRRENPSAKVAILVRNRGHLNEIVPQIKALGLRFRAVEIEQLCYKPVVQDLLILTRALIHPADRLAWFALLRAPWCGLTLKDLTAFASTGIMPQSKAVVNENKLVKKKPQAVWELLNDENHLCAISVDGYARITRLREILAQCLANRYRQTLRATVEAAWLAMGGPGCLNYGEGGANQGATDLEDAVIYLDYLESHEVAGEIQDLAVFEHGLTKLYALPDLEADETLQIMTIHKSKGLEFDCVIVPGLGRASRHDDKRLLKWTERPRGRFNGVGDDDIIDLLLAPIHETGVNNDPIYTWLQRLDNDKAHFEDQRLLYVAATRAKKTLHLLGDVGFSQDKAGVKQPVSGSLLNKLWQVVRPIYDKAADKLLLSSVLLPQNRGTDNESRMTIDQSNYRLESNWTLPPSPKPVMWCASKEKMHTNDEIEFSWAGEIARHIGTVVHRWLQRIAEDEMKGWDAARIQGLHFVLKQALVANGMCGSKVEIENATQRVIASLTHSLSDSRGQWLLGPHQEAQNELRMTATINGERLNVVIDRTFCDLDGKRWIVDYKTSGHEGGGVEAFLDREQARYRSQLERYALLMRMIDSRELRLGLFFPLLKGWRAWKVE
jgi:ATP-dependent helicase/nuclease subunit A